jgi:hypothetical protein
MRHTTSPAPFSRLVAPSAKTPQAFFAITAALGALAFGIGCAPDPCDTEDAFPGTYFIRSQSDVEGLEGFLCVTGSLVVGSMPHEPDSTGSGIQEPFELSVGVFTLDGLEDLEIVEGDVHIAGNTLLVSIEGLSGLQAVGREVRFQKYPRGDLIIHQNGLLRDLDGLSSLTLVGASFVVSNNSILNDIDGASALERVGWELKFLDNPELDTTDIQDWASDKAAVGGLVASGNGGSGGGQ